MFWAYDAGAPAKRASILYYATAVAHLARSHARTRFLLAKTYKSKVQFGHDPPVQLPTLGIFVD